MDMLHGIAIGHIYYFLFDVIPFVYGKDVLKTPMFMIDYFGIGEYRPQAAVPNNPYRPPGGGDLGSGSVRARGGPAPG